MIPKLEKFIGEMSASPATFWEHCSIHHIAVLLGVHRATIYEWQKKHLDFGDTIKKWEERRNALFLELKDKRGAWIFLAKNWLEMRDEQRIEHTGDFQPLRVIVSENGGKPDA